MPHDWPCLGIALAVPIFLGLSALFFTLWLRARRQASNRAEEVEALQAALKAWSGFRRSSDD